MEFQGKVAVVTGGAGGIGKCITGENICIDGGMTRQMIYHDEHGWSLDTLVLPEHGTGREENYTEGNPGAESGM